MENGLILRDKYCAIWIFPNSISFELKELLLYTDWILNNATRFSYALSKICCIGFLFIFKSLLVRYYNIFLA